MIPWWWLLITLFVGFLFGFFLYSLFKISADSDRMWEGYYQKLKEERERKKNVD